MGTYIAVDMHMPHLHFTLFYDTQYAQLIYYVLLWLYCLVWLVYLCRSSNSFLRYHVTSLLTLIWSVQCQCFSVAGWQSLTEKQKQIVTLSLYHAANWIRELVSAIAGIFIVMVDSNIHYGLQCFFYCLQLNAFCTQVAGRLECISQTTKQEIIAKLLKRVRNLVYVCTHSS